MSSHTVLVRKHEEMQVATVTAYGAGVQIHIEDLAAHLAGTRRGDAQARGAELEPCYDNLASKTRGWLSHAEGSHVRLNQVRRHLDCPHAGELVAFYAKITAGTIAIGFLGGVCDTSSGAAIAQ